MTRIEDMSSTQRQAWLVLLADGAVFVWFWQKMTSGLTVRPINYDISDFGAIIVGVVILTIILHAAIAAIFDIMSKSEKTARDERDVEIERRGSHIGYRILQFGIGAVIVLMLTGAGMDGGFEQPIELIIPVQIIFALMVVSYIADLVKHAVMIHGYGR